MNTGHFYTTDQLAEIVARRQAGDTWESIAAAVNKLYGTDLSHNAVRFAYKRNEHLFAVAKDKVAINLLKETARVKRAHSQTAQRSKAVLDALNQQDDLLEQLKDMVEKLPKLAVGKPPAPAKDKPGLTVEALISDVHVGKKTATFDVEVCRARLRLFTQVLMQEITRKQAHYNVERVILGILGDIIENALMHGRESMASCEFDNAEQVRYAIELLFTEVVTPLARTGLALDVVCIGGNHDRQEERPTFNNPGKNGLGWIIYTTLKMLADQAGFKHLKWHIPEGVYAVLDVYGDRILYEHGDRIRGDNGKKSFLTHLAHRSGQLGTLLKGIRVGHWHEFSCYDNGAVIVNGSVCGQDSYADVNGYNTVPGQVITFYVRTKNRPSAYYYSFLVQLGQVGKQPEGKK